MTSTADYIAALLILLILAGSVLVMTLWLAPAMLTTAAWWVVAILALAIWTAISAEVTYDEEMQLSADLEQPPALRDADEA